MLATINVGFRSGDILKSSIFFFALFSLPRHSAVLLIFQAQVDWNGSKQQLTYFTLSCAPTEQKSTRKRKFSLIFAVYSLIFFAFTAALTSSSQMSYR